MSVCGIIPARYASTRFPGKPLVDIGGRSMIARVVDRCQQATLLGAVVVATDDDRIAQHVAQHTTAQVVMTSPAHLTGTDRMAEAARILEGQRQHFAAYVNIQGDEPFIAPEQIDQVAAPLLVAGTEIVTLVRQEPYNDDLLNPNSVKVVRRSDGQALYFSRSLVPYLRNRPDALLFYRHVGIYGFRADVLQHVATLPPGLLEQAESLEQLRWLEHGLGILTVVTEHPTYAVDTPDDLLKLPVK